MKIDKVPGEFAFKCLFKLQYTEVGNDRHTPDRLITHSGWSLSSEYYLNIEEAKKAHGNLVLWPIEIYEDGSIYIPSKEELE